MFATPATNRRNVGLRPVYESKKVQLAVSVNVTAAPPSANCPWALTDTGPFVDGSVRLTEAVPEELVSAITLVPLAVPLESVPADVVKRMPAPVPSPQTHPEST